MKHSLPILAAVIILSQSCFVRVRIPADVLAELTYDSSSEVIENATVDNAVNSVSLYSSFNLNIHKGDTARYEISAPSQYSDLVVVKREEDRLIFSSKPNSIILGEVNIELYLPDLQTVHVSGSGDVKVDSVDTPEAEFKVTGSGDISIGSVKCDNLSLVVSGSGDVSAKGIDCKELEARVTGSGDIAMSGNADKAVFIVSGSGDIDGRHLRHGSVTQKVTGSGDIRL